MEKLTEIQIKEGNRKLAEFMGYTFYHKGVDIDTSDIGGIYERFEVFSKVPIMVDEYPEEDQYYFSDFPNPDFKNANNPKWNSDYEFLSWSTLNYHDFKYGLRYHSDWNELREVIEHIDSLTSIGNINLKINGLNIFSNIETVFSACVEFADWCNHIKNDKNEL